MSELTLYHAPRTRSGTALWMLEELGVPYDLHVLDLGKADHKSPQYLAINPMGKVPALKHGETIVTEVAAICCYLADAFPQAGLAPAIGDPRRGPYLRWLFFSPSCIEPAMADKALKRPPAPASTLGHGDFDTVVEAVAQGVSRGEYLLGDQFSAADVVVGSAVRYGMLFGMWPERPEFTAYAARMAERPACKRAEQRDAELAASNEPA